MKREELVPPYGELYPQEAEDFRSEDRQILMKEFLKKEFRFIIRLVGERDLILRERKKRTISVGHVSEI